MIITITGMPCSGKSTVSEIFAQKHGFEMLDMGQLFKAEAARLGLSSAQFSAYRTKDPKFDIKMDKNLIPLGKKRKDDNLIISSRVAWHFIPNSFKVFVDINEDVMVQRLLDSNRTGKEQYSSQKAARDALMQRMNDDANVYKNTYGIDIMDKSNYDFVLNTSYNTPEELADILWQEYQNFLKKR